MASKNPLVFQSVHTGPYGGLHSGTAEAARDDAQSEFRPDAQQTVSGDDVRLTSLAGHTTPNMCGLLRLIRCRPQECGDVLGGFSADDILE